MDQFVQVLLFVPFSALLHWRRGEERGATVWVGGCLPASQFKSGSGPPPGTEIQCIHPRSTPRFSTPHTHSWQAPQTEPSTSHSAGPHLLRIPRGILLHPGGPRPDPSLLPPCAGPAHRSTARMRRSLLPHPPARVRHVAPVGSHPVFKCPMIEYFNLRLLSRCKYYSGLSLDVNRTCL